MSIETKNIKLNGTTLNLKFSLNMSVQPYDNQESIDNLINTTTNELINPIIDTECRRFRGDIPFTIGFTFNEGFDYFTTGFTQTELNNSFFILDYYDSYNTNNQVRKFTNYLTKLNPYPVYPIDNTGNQLYYWYIPESYITEITENNITGYIKFSFYNAKTGTISMFYNADNELLTTSEKYFFRADLDISGRTWNIITSSFPLVHAIEIPVNSLYNNRLNNTINSQIIGKQEYPPNTIFSYITRNYE